MIAFVKYWFNDLLLLMSESVGLFIEGLLMYKFVEVMTFWYPNPV